MMSTEEEIFYDADGKLVWDTNPAVQATRSTSARRPRSRDLTAKLGQFEDPEWDQGFGTGVVRDHRLPVVDDRLHQGQGG